MAVRPASPLRRTIRCAYLNGLLWAVGNGLLGTTLVIYLAFAYRGPAQGLSIGLLLAAPKLAGLLRAVAPGLVAAVGSRKWLAIGAYLASAAVLVGIPWLAWSPDRLTPEAGVWLLVGLWCGYHVLEYFGTTALFSWLGDAVPARVRPTFLGWRERWLVLGGQIGIWAAVALSAAWSWPQVGEIIAGWFSLGQLPRNSDRILLASLGIGLFVLAAIILVPARDWPRPTQTPGPERRSDVRWMPSSNRPYWRLLVFNMWFSASNGVTQSAQRVLEIAVLGISLPLGLALRGGSAAAQILITPSVGRLILRRGTLQPLVPAQMAVAAGLVGYVLAAVTGQWWWIILAFVCWIAYAVHNVGLPTLLWARSTMNDRTPAVGWYQALTDAAFAGGTLAGSYAYDLGRATLPTIGAIGGQTRQLAVVMLLVALLVVGLVARSWAAVLASKLGPDHAPEPVPQPTSPAPSTRPATIG